MKRLLVACLLGVAMPITALAASEGRVPEGKALIAAKGCFACHSDDGTQRVGPSFLGLWPRLGAERLRRSLEEPDAEISEGFPASVMPVAQLDEQELADLAAALGDLAGGNAPVKEPPGSMWSLAAAAFLFCAVHFFFTSTAIRSPLVAKLGVAIYTGVLGLLVVVIFAWLIYAWAKAPYVAVWHPHRWTRLVPQVVMPFAFILLMAGLLTKNPTNVGQQTTAAQAVRGINCVTRHPQLWSYVLWGSAHLCTNGQLNELLFFGSFIVLAVGGMLHIDARRGASGDEGWATFKAQTSVIPFAAALAGRNKISFAEIGAIRIGAGIACYVLWLFVHPLIVGASPF